jgi:hypothetical protein
MELKEVDNGVKESSQWSLRKSTMELKEVARVLNAKYSVLFRAALYRTRGDYIDMSSIWLTNSALVYEAKCGGRGGVAES